MLISVSPSVGPHEKLTLIRIITHTSEVTNYGQVSQCRALPIDTGAHVSC